LTDPFAEAPKMLMVRAPKTTLPEAQVRPRLALAPGSVSDRKSLRAAADDSDHRLRDRTLKWLAALPPDLRPIVTGRDYPRIVNRISDLWSQCEYTRLHFQSLLVDRRTGRSGFPPEVGRELEALQHHYFLHLSGLPALLWNAVPLNPPRIPDRAFAPLADAKEIDISPL
jgi:hypothetical protein